MGRIHSPPPKPRSWQRKLLHPRARARPVHRPDPTDSFRRTARPPPPSKTGLALGVPFSYVPHSGCGGRAVECGGLLNRCTGKTVPGVRIPPAPVYLRLIFFPLATAWSSYLSELQGLSRRIFCPIQALLCPEKELGRLPIVRVLFFFFCKKARPNIQTPQKRANPLQVIVELLTNIRIHSLTHPSLLRMINRCRKSSFGLSVGWSVYSCW